MTRHFNRDIESRNSPGALSFFSNFMGGDQPKREKTKKVIMKQVMRNDVPQGVTTYAPVPQVEQTAREETQASFDYDLSEPLI